MEQDYESWSTDRLRRALRDEVARIAPVRRGKRTMPPEELDERTDRANRIASVLFSRARRG